MSSSSSSSSSSHVELASRTTTQRREAQIIESLTALSTQLTKEVLENNGEPSIERCRDIFLLIQREVPSKMTISIVDKTRIGKTFTKVIKSFKRHSRTAASEDQAAWNGLIINAEQMVSSWKQGVEKQENEKTKKKKDTTEDPGGYPSTVAIYRNRLQTQKKEMFKDPPVMPPSPVEIQKSNAPQPRRRQNGEVNLERFPHFVPNRTPEEVLRAGSFGGTYFRSITSAVTGITYNADQVLKDTCPSEWVQGLDKRAMLLSQTYRKEINKYKVKCGGSLGMWESSGWIADSDPYGWFQWYCRFYQGRRCSDDERQIGRWARSAGPKGRFRSQLCNKCISSNAKADDVRISPVIRQTLLHWGFELTEETLEKHRRSKK